MGSQIKIELPEDERPSILLPVYPKPLAERDIGPRFDENGFTAVEKAALRNAWRFIEPFQRRYGQATFYAFLTEHENLINSFRINTKIHLGKLHGHATAMMKLLSKLVHTLDESLQFRSSLDENLPFHLKSGIDIDYMKLLAVALKDYLLACPEIKNHNSCTLTTALEKLVTIVGEYAEADDARKKALSVYYRSTNSNPIPKNERTSSVQAVKEVQEVKKSLE
ncbi:uncharacterized protein LOC117897996 [Drosophila subobscura]|uniref:uncharacterized protein LOC117897996 n=1 Tax=Drosophila subobscura TaxID=7241 RepID=UPI00155ABD52|nr:uncharacterized protein LOC117897996 [Drosophila subobscura]